MLINQGIRIYLEDPATAPDNPALGITAGVATLLEGTGSIPPSVTYYRNDLFPKKWNSGFSDKFDFRTHVRPQIIGDCTVTISNVNNYYSDLQNAGYELEGKRVEFVFYTDDVVGAYSPASPYFVKSVESTATVIQLKLAGIDSQQHIDISKPITGDTWEPVIIGDHEKGVYVSTGIVREAPDEKNWRFLMRDTGISRTPPDHELRERGTVYSTIMVPEDRDETTPGDYITEKDNLYLSIDTGDGDGSYRVNNTSFASPDSIRALFETVPVLNIDGTGEIKTLSSEEDITTVSAGNIEIITGEFIGDPNSTQTEDPIFTDSGEEVPYGVLVKDGTSIKIGFGKIDGSTISGNGWIEPVAAGSAASQYTTGGTSENISVTQNNTGNKDSVVDRDATTYIGSTWDISADYVPGDEVIVTSSIDVVLKGDFTKAEYGLHDILVDIGGNDDISSPIPSGLLRKVDVSVIYDYIWESTPTWGVISDPLQTAEKVNSWGDLNISPNVPDLQSRQVVFKCTPPSYYEGDVESVYVNDNYDFITSTSTTGGARRGIFSTGKDVVRFDNSISGSKAPDGLRVTVRIVDHTLNSELVPNSASYSNGIRIFSAGAITTEVQTQVSGTVSSSVQGRPYNTFKLYQEHISKLLNWSLNHKTKPEIGWGLAESTDANVNTFDTSTEAIRSQWTNPSELNTKKQIEILCRESWNAMVSKNDAKSWYSFLDKIGAETPTNSYVAPSDCRIVSAVPFDEQDIYNVYTVEYDYDIVTNTYLKSISITKPSQDDYSAEYVSGITDTSVASSIWNKCKVLYDVAGSEKKLPDNLSKLRHVYTEEVAIQHILNYIEFFGVNGSSVYNPNYLVVADHPVEHLFVSAPMNTIGYTSKGLWGGVEATGIITGRKYNAGEPKRVQITSIVKPTFILGRIIEQDGNVDRIIEDDANTNRIVEV